MATGVSKGERSGVDAESAVQPHRDPHPLPADSALPTLTYPGKLATHEVLSPIRTQFLSVGHDGSTGHANISPNSLILADNLFALHEMVSTGQRATLIYMDPPYNTGMDFHSRSLEHSYNDSRGGAAYLEYIRRRLILLREVLTEDGSIYVHIGHQMVSHLKVVMDEVFGSGQFRNLITRRKCSSKNFTKHQYANLNDYVLFYSKGNNYKWNQPGERPDQEWIDKEYTHQDAKGRYKLVPVHAPGTRQGETGGRWRGKLPPAGKHWQYTPSKLDDLDSTGDIHWSGNGNPRRKVYLTADKVVPYTDYWAQFRDAHHQSVGITGYPTEKNIEMLRMIVSAGSDPGDVVLDPFCGSGTTLGAAEKLGRKWIGIDQSFAAARASLGRLRHGVEAMGDFVEKPAKSGVVVDLFSNERNPQLQRRRSPDTSVASTKFEFLVDQAVANTLRAEVMAVAST